jgi:transglutaminase-like putative cysteine protease
MQLNAKTIESTSEHYIEYSAFFNYNFHLETKFISNEEVRSKFAIKGLTSNYDTIERLYAVVSKGDQKTSFNIPLTDTGDFDSFLYTPFGVGKHNITLYAKTKDTTKDEAVLQFSVINLSSKVTKYLIPSLYAQSDTVEARSLASFLTHQTTSSYLRAQAIYEYIISDISLESETFESLENLKTSNEVIISETATPLEANILLATLLRATNIPSKVYMGQIGTRIYYFVSAEINGVWSVFDPVTEKLSITNPELTVKRYGVTPNPFTEFDKQFYLNDTQYKGLMDGTQLLSY